MKKIIIGDLHGNFPGLNYILEKSEYDPANDQLIFVGDYIDGFPGKDFSAKKTIEIILDLKKENKNIVTLIGNHDWWMLEWIKVGIERPLSIWYNQGGQETLASYGIIDDFPIYKKLKKFIPNKHKKFLEELIPSYYDDEIVVVHGGFRNKMDMLNVFDKMELEQFTLKYPIHAQSMYGSMGYTSNYPIYNILWDRDFYKTGVNSLLDSYKDIFGNRIFICGHTPYGPNYTEKNVKRYLIDGGSKGGGYLNCLTIKDGVCKLISEK